MPTRDVIWRFAASGIVLQGILTGCKDHALPVESDARLQRPSVATVQSPVVPIPQQPGALPVPAFVGAPAAVSPVFATRIPQNRFLAANGTSNIHNDSYMSDTYEIAGPLGRTPYVFSTFLGTMQSPQALPISMAFDRYGRIVLIVIGVTEARLMLLDPATLEALATMPIPASGPAGSNVVAGGYFYLDRLERAILPTAAGEIWVVEVTGGWNRPRFDLKRVYDLTGVVGSNDQIGSVLPDFSGTLWAVTKGGTVATINPANGRVRHLRLAGEGIENSLAADETGGVFIVTDHALYRFDASADGAPAITWREVYDRGTRRKPGQFNQGSGTTPTLMGDKFVAITDNADPYMNVLVYQRAATINGPRLVTSVPVFQANASATENSLVATERTIVVENNYGYSSHQATLGGQSTTPGVSRIDLDATGQGSVVWTSGERVPSLVTKVSLANGLIYTYTKDPGPGTTDAWYFTAIDFVTGQTIWKQLAGTGLLYNNHYSGIYLGPDGTLYVGVGGGVVALADRP